MTTIKKQVESIIAEYTQSSADEFYQAEKFADLAIDSLSLVEIVFDLEEAFDIKIPNEVDLESSGYSIESYNDVLALVHALIKEK